VVGVLADLAGDPDPSKPQLPLKKRYFTEINRDTFNDVMAKIEPRLELRVENTLQKDGSKLGLELKFNSINDFEPEQVVRQIEPLRQLLEIRQKLADLKSKAGSNDKLDSILQKIVQNVESLKKQAATATDSTTTNGEA
jgi:type VI secretion system protein ImpB